MANWSKPIYDRTQADVDYAKSQIKYFKQNGGITDGKDLKGCLNVDDLNRIEFNTEYISDLLITLCYFNNINKHSDRWYVSSVPYVNHINRIIDNVLRLQTAYFKPSGSPTLPTTLTHYEDVNSIEKCLYLLKVMIDDMVSSFRECGTFNCGED